MTQMECLRKDYLAKAKLRMLARAMLKTPHTDDFPCYSVDEDWHDPPLGNHCWVFHWNYHWVAKCSIIEKIEGNRDRDDTWRCHITLMMEDGPTYYVGMTETFIRHQIWPTKKECFTSLFGHLEEEIIGKERDLSRLKTRCNEVERFM